MKQLYFSAFLLLATSSAFTQDGSLDNTFDGDGMALTSVGSFDDMGQAIQVQTDGKIVVAGQSYAASDYDFLVARYLPDGALDTTFGNGGIVVTPVGSLDDRAYDLAIQNDGKIVVTGTITDGLSEDIAVVRYTPDGDLDQTFDDDGILILAIPTTNENAQGIAIQSDGKIVIAGSQYNVPEGSLLLLRFNTNGTPDATFDGDGMVLSNFFANHEEMINDVKLQSDGKIVVAGFADTGTNADFIVARYNTNGSPDNTFDADGYRTHAITGTVNEFANALAIQNDGKIVLTGWTDNNLFDVVVTRYNADGSDDNTFDTDAIALLDFGSGSDYGAPTDVLIQSDGKIILAGYRNNGNRLNFALLRYTTTGSPDNTFDADGMVMTDFGGAYDCQGTAVTMQTDGKILVVGASYDAQNEVAIARYNNTVNSNIGLSEMTVTLLELAPNPFTEQTVITFSTAITNGTLIITSASGENVREIQAISGESIVLNRDDLPSGMYFAQLHTEAFVGTARFLIQD